MSFNCWMGIYIYIYICIFIHVIGTDIHIYIHINVLYVFMYCLYIYIYTQTFIYCQAQLPDTMWTRRPTPKSASQAGFFSCQAVFMCINIYIYMIIYIYNKLPRKTVPQRLQRHIVVHDDNECVCVCMYVYIYIYYITIASRLTQVPMVPNPPPYPPPGRTTPLEMYHKGGVQNV